MLMEIPVLLANGEEETNTGEATAIEVHDHPGFVPANGNWICRCGIGNFQAATRCIKCRKNKE